MRAKRQNLLRLVAPYSVNTFASRQYYCNFNPASKHGTWHAWSHCLSFPKHDHPHLWHMTKNITSWSWIFPQDILVDKSCFIGLEVHQRHIYFYIFHQLYPRPGDTAVSCSIQMKASGKQVFLSFQSYYPLYGYNHKSQKVYFYK